MGRPAEARALVAEARKGAPPPVASYEVEAGLLDRDGKTQDAMAALVKAEEMGSTNFYAHLLLARLTLRGTPDTAAWSAAEKRLRRAVELNDAYAPSLILLANVLVQQRQAQPAIEFATRAARLEPQDPDGRLALARALWAASRQADAMGHARAALLLTRTPDERQRAQELIDFLAKAAPR
jgi:tetratricopeptide (TPR) repeat protein